MHGASAPRVRPVVLAVIALQVALPATMLVLRWVEEGSRPVSERPASFQMYSSAVRPGYVGTDGSGRRRMLDVDRLPPVLRAVDTGRVVPDRLCARDRTLIEVERVGGPAPGTFGC